MRGYVHTMLCLFMKLWMCGSPFISKYDVGEVSLTIRIQIISRVDKVR